MFDEHRKAAFQNLGIGQAAVGHMGLDRTGPGKSRPRPGAARDRFVMPGKESLPKVKLFIVPWLAASAAKGAEQLQSVTAWLVSTLPATTAAG